MIELVKVGKYFPTSSGRHYLFRDVSLKLPLDKNIGVIGPNGAGKSTFLRLLSGSELPSEGRIIRTGKISWSLGMSPGLQPSMTGAENTRFAARVYGMRSREIKATIEKVRELADVGKYFDMPLQTYSAGMRQKLSFAMSMSMDFEYYLFDEISAGGDVRFRERTQRMIKERLSKANFVVVTHNHGEVMELCQACILIGDGNLTYFDSVQEALDRYNELYGSPETERKLKKAAERQALQAKRAAAAESATGTEGRRRVAPLPLAPRLAQAGPAIGMTHQTERPTEPAMAGAESSRAAAEARKAAAAEERAIVMAEKRAKIDAKRVAAASRRGTAGQAGEQRAQRMAERRARFDTKKAAAAARLEAANRAGEEQGHPRAAKREKPAADRRLKHAAAHGTQHRRGARSGKRPAAERTPPTRPPVAELRQSLTQLVGQLSVADPSARGEVNRIRKKIAETRRQLKALAARRAERSSRHAGSGHADAAPKVASQKQSEE